jgi:hypothetical protein
MFTAFQYHTLQDGDWLTLRTTSQSGTATVESRKDFVHSDSAGVLTNASLTMAILTPPSNTGAQQELPTPKRAARSIDFTTHRLELSLGSLKSADIFAPGFLIVLDNYQTVLQQGGSIALSRGETLASVCLDRSLSGLFSTETPTVI